MNGPVRARRLVGWLLRTSRVFNEADTVLRSGKEFARLFRERGEPPLAPSHVTRWEHGDLAVSRTIVRRYEHMLALPPDSLVAVCDAVCRIESVRPEPPGHALETEALHDLLTRATGKAAMSGQEWSSLGELVSSAPDLILHPPHLWEAVSNRLLDELVVADHTEWLLRQEAMSRLLEHPTAGRYAAARCIDVVCDPRSYAVLEPLSLLDVTPDPVANAFVLAQIEQPNDERTLQGALLTAAHKLKRGHYAAHERGVITATAARWARESRNPDQLAVSAASPGHRLRPGEDETSHRIALLAQAALSAPGTDPLLDTLIKRALFGEDLDQRLAAAVCLAATPYQRPIGNAILALVDEELARRDETLTLSGLQTLTNLGVDVHRPAIHRILTSPGFSMRLRLAAARALPHCRGEYSETVWRDLLTRFGAMWRLASSPALDRVLQAIAYGIGTDGHAGLVDEIRADTTLPDQARGLAAWLRRSHRLAAVPSRAVGSPVRMLSG